MTRHIRSLPLVVILSAFAPGLVQPTRGQPDAATKVTVVDGRRLTFDPRTCAEGSGGHVSTGLEGATVRVLGRRDGFREFEYRTDGCGGVGSVYLCKVRLDSGPVTVEVKTVTEGTSTFAKIVNSFPRAQMKLLRHNGPGVVQLPVGDTGEFVAYTAGERRSEMLPAKGDRVRFRFRVPAGPRSDEPLPGATQDAAVEYVAGAGTGWAWLEAASEGMSVGDRRRVTVPLRIAEGAARWVPDARPGSDLHLEVALVSLERAPR